MSFKTKLAEKRALHSNALCRYKLGAASLILGGLFLTSACTTTRGNPNHDAVSQVIRDSGPAQPATTVSSNTTETSNNGSRGRQSSNLEVWGQKLKNSKFDYPVIINPAVEHWLSYFTGKGRKFFEKYLERGRFFIPTISKVLKSHNMPQDLVYLAMIESGFNNSAKSHARAVGPWQFIKQTGQRYGMKVDYWLDERRDTRKSTLAAISYLKELYQEFGSWELAASGYNAGEGKVRRAISKYKTHDFWEIAKKRFFRRETRDYVPKIMAAAILTKNAEMFGFVDVFSSNGVVNPTLFEEDEELTPKELGEPLANTDDTEEDAVEKMVTETAETDDAEATDEESEDHAMVSLAPNPAMTPTVYMVSNPHEQIIEYEVKGPTDLFAISKAAGLPYSTIKLLNPELLRWCTPPYMKNYKIKLPLSVKDRFLATYNDESFDRKVVFLKYHVKNGDSIQRVAKRFGVDPVPIREINQMGKSDSYLRVGSMISLPLPTGSKRVIASMYDDKPMPPSRRKRYRRARKARKDTASGASHRYRLKPSVRVAEDR